MNQVVGGGSVGIIQMDPDELTHIIKEIIDILNEFDMNIVPAINRINGIAYLTEGKAKKAMEAVPKANERVLELQDQMVQVSSLISDILQTMLGVDKEIGEKTIAAQQIGGTGK